MKEDVWSHVSIILPTKNEEENIEGVLSDIIGCNGVHPLDILVVDDSDNSETKKAVYKFGEEKSNDLLSLKVIEGMGKESPSIQKALTQSKKYSIVMDSDGSHPAIIIPYMVEAIESGVDVAVGSRYTEGGQRGSSSIISVVGNMFVRPFLGLKTKELTSRFIMSTKKILLKSSTWDSRGDNALDVINHAEKMGYVIEEIPFRHGERMGGKSTTNIPKYLLMFFKRIMRIKLDRYRPFSETYIARALSGQYAAETASSNSNWNVSVLYNMQIPLSLFFGLMAFLPVFSSVFSMFAQNYPSGIIGFFLRNMYWRNKLGYCGQDVFIDQGVIIYPNARSVRIDRGTYIDMGAKLICSDGVLRIGKYCHIGSDVYMNCKPYIDIGDYVCIDHGSKIFASTNKPGVGRIASYSCVAPLDYQELTYVGVTIGDFAFIAPNSVLTCADVGENSIVGAISFVKSDVASNTIAGGVPTKTIKFR